MDICVVGVGYIGLPTAAILANSGHQVSGFDINKDYLDMIRHRLYKTKEKDLLTLINKGMDEKHLCFNEDIQMADTFIICTPTPLGSDGKADLSYLLDALDKVLSIIKKGNLVIIESTIPLGTIDILVKPRIEKDGFIVGENIYLCYCPERVLPNNIIYELINNSRIIGGCTPKCREKAQDIYKTFVKAMIYTDDAKVVELVKLVENSYRDVNIAFVNELALLCEELNIDPYRVIELSNKHPRVNLMSPGIGVGGHCLPVDSHFIIENNISYSKMIQTSRAINDKMPQIIANSILSLLNGINEPIVTIWGIAYKENSSDIRKSPALEISRILESNSVRLKIYDPLVYDHTEEYGLSTLKDSDLLLVLVKHDNFLSFDYNLVVQQMNSPKIFDAVNILNNTSLNPEIKIYRLFN